MQENNKNGNEGSESASGACAPAVAKGPNVTPIIYSPANVPKEVLKHTPDEGHGMKFSKNL